MDIEDGAGEALEESGCEDVHVTGADDECGALLDEPARHREVSCLARLEVGQLEYGHGDSRPSRPLERVRAGHVARDARDRQAGVDQRLEVRARAGDEDADHESEKTTPPEPRSIRPIAVRPLPTASAAGTTAQ